MKKLICVFLGFFVGCSGWGDESVSEIDHPCLNSIVPVQVQFSLLCRDRPDGDSCSDGLWCNGEETCQGGVCVPGEPPCDTPCDEMHRICADECVFDSDCDDGLWCTGAEWCCTREKADWHCEKYHCYPGVSPCGHPVWGVLTVCDREQDVCRPCQADEECDDGCWCNGMERCGTKADGHHYGVCLHAVGSNPCGDDEICNDEKHACEPAPECRRDSDCSPEMWCDENGKCQSWGHGNNPGDST
jgi:hypothetical protein